MTVGAIGVTVTTRSRATSGWRQVASGRSDALGHIAVHRRSPWRVGFRLRVEQDGDAVLGTTSTSAAA